MSFGVFQDYYSQHASFKGDKNISVIGTCGTAILYLGSPFTTSLVLRYPKYRSLMVWIGWPIAIGGLVGASFAKDVPTLIATQGVLYGTGILILYFPILSFVNEWFVRKRGLAYGILTASTGASGIVFPFIIEALLSSFGYARALQSIAVALAVATFPLIPLLKARLPVSQSNASQRINFSFLMNPLFYLYSAANTLQGLGYWFPSLFLPSFATSIGLSASEGALLLALFSFAQILGQVSFGYLSDKRIPLDALIVVATVVSAVSSFTIWGLARSLAPLIAFSLIYGLFGAGYVVLWARMGSALSDDPTAALATFSAFAFEKGVGNVLAGPISAALISSPTVLSGYALSRYKGIIVFTGVCMFLSSLTIGAWYLRPKIITR